LQETSIKYGLSALAIFARQTSQIGLRVGARAGIAVAALREMRR
jgi:hypothetical protein